MGLTIFMGTELKARPYGVDREPSRRLGRGQHPGQTVRHLIRSKGMTQETAAHKAGIGVAFLSKIVRNKRILDAELASQLADKWDLTPDERKTLVEVSIPATTSVRKTIQVRHGAASGDLGKFVREKRILLGMKGKDLAQRCGLKLPRLVVIEKGEAVPNPLTAARIASALELSNEESARFFRYFACAVVHHGDISRSHTVPALVALAEWMLFSHHPQITGNSDSIVAPDFHDLQKLRGAAAAVRAELLKCANTIRLPEDANGSPSGLEKIVRAIIRDKGKTTLVVPVLVTL